MSRLKEEVIYAQRMERERGRTGHVHLLFHLGLHFADFLSFVFHFFHALLDRFEVLKEEGER